MTLSIIVIVLIVILVIALIGLYVFYNRGDERLQFDIGGSSPRAAGGSDPSPERTMRTRLLGFGLSAVAVVGVLFARLWSMQLISKDDYTSQAESNRTRRISLPAKRGRILDRNGNELVGNRPSLTVVAKPSVADESIEVQLLGNIIGMPPSAVRRRIQDQSAGAQSDRVVASDVPRRVVAYIGEHSDAFSDIEVEERSVRTYPYGNLAAHVVGYTGTVSQEQLEQSSQNTDAGSITYETGDTVGQAGIEYSYEDVLQGIRGERNVFVDANGTVLGQSSTVEPQDGSDVMLTIDVKLQKACEESLAKVIKAIRSSASPDCDAGSVIVLEVETGDVLAMASAPTYSPNIFVGGISNDDWTMLQSEDSDNPLMNRAISGLYPSASTIKPFSTYAALDNGIAFPNSQYYCAGWWTGFGDGSGQYCYQRDGHGAMTLSTGITYSCDVVFYEIGKGFYYSDKPEAFQAKLHEWGLATMTDIDLPGEAEGRIPDSEWKWNYYSNVPESERQFKGGDFTNLSIGQGDLLVTPIQMACAYAGIAGKGRAMRPHVLKSVLSRTGTGSVVDYENQELRFVEEAEEYQALVHEGLVGAVYVESEFIANHFSELTTRVAAKSGTAERAGQNPTAWYIAFAPAEAPKYVVASTIENATWASMSAMFVARDVLGAIYNQPDTKPISISAVSVGAD